MSRCCAKPTHAATAQPPSTSGVAVPRFAAMEFLPSPGGGGSARMKMRTRGGVTVSQRPALSDVERPSPRPVSHCMRTDPPPPGEGKTTRLYRFRMNPTISLVARMVSSAMTRARSAPSINILSTWPGSATSRFISEAIGDSFATQSSTSAFLKLENCPPPNSCQNGGLAALGQRGIDADEVVGLGPALQALFFRRQRFRIGLGFPDFLRDGVGVVGQVDARIVRGVRLRHLLGAVAQATSPASPGP